MTFLIFGFVCLFFAMFPLPIRTDVDPALARVGIAVAVTWLLVELSDYFRERHAQKRPRRSGASNLRGCRKPSAARET